MSEPEKLLLVFDSGKLPSVDYDLLLIPTLSLKKEFEVADSKVRTLSLYPLLDEKFLNPSPKVLHISMSILNVASTVEESPPVLLLDFIQFSAGMSFFLENTLGHIYRVVYSICKYSSLERVYLHDCPESATAWPLASLATELIQFIDPSVTVTRMRG